jgi:hypothetical protein
MKVTCLNKYDDDDDDDGLANNNDDNECMHSSTLRPIRDNVEYNYSHVPAVGIDWGRIVLTYHFPSCTSGLPGDGTN